MGEYTEGVIKMSCCIFLQRFGKEKAMIKYEQTILHGVIIALVAATVTALALAGVAVGRMRMAQDELANRGGYIKRCPVCGQRIDWEGEGK